MTVTSLDVNQRRRGREEGARSVSGCAKVTRTDEKGKAKGITRQSGQPERPRGTGCGVFSESTVSLGSISPAIDAKNRNQLDLLKVELGQGVSVSALLDILDQIILRYDGVVLWEFSSILGLPTG